MEKEGLDRALKLLKQKKIKVKVLVTDRHKQINKWLRDSHKEIKHYYDVWHVAKGKVQLFLKSLSLPFVTGLRKKLDKLAKDKDCKIVAEWIHSIINHFYWSVTSTTDGNEEMVQAKWLSLVNHVHNRHSKHGGLFPKCTHKRLKRRKKKWIKWRKF